MGVSLWYFDRGFMHFFITLSCLFFALFHPAFNGSTDDREMPAYKLLIWVRKVLIFLTCFSLSLNIILTTLFSKTINLLFFSSEYETRLHTDIYKARRFYSYYHYNLLKMITGKFFLEMAVGKQLCYRETSDDKFSQMWTLYGGLTLFSRRN